MKINLTFVVRLASFISIASGVLTLLSHLVFRTRPTGQAWNWVVGSPDEAVGLILLGFAVRLSRLESHSKLVRVVVKTSRAGLLVIGVSQMLGLQVVLLGHTPQALSAETPAFATGLSNVLIGSLLTMQRSRWAGRLSRMLPYLACAWLGACWTSALLGAAGLTAVPAVLAIGWLPAALLTAIAFSLSVSVRTPGLADLLSGTSPGAEAARQMFPFAFAVPLGLAILRQHAENAGYLHPQLGLFLHVFMSVLGLAVLIAWNAYRLNFAHRVHESVETAGREIQKAYDEMLAVIENPAWVLGRDGQVLYENAAAKRFAPERQSMPDGPFFDAERRAMVAGAIIGTRKRTATILRNGMPVEIPLVLVKAVHAGSPENTRILVLAKAEIHDPIWDLASATGQHTVKPQTATPPAGASGIRQALTTQA